MQLNLVDRISFDAKSLVITADGYLVAQPRISRTGIQLYRGSEVGMKDKAVVRVYRPEAEVFHEDSMRSMAHRPLTNDHPPVPVTADNWKEYSVGQSGGEVVRDGEFVRVPMAFMDKAAIADIKAGKKQLSVGYSCDMEFTPGVTPDGQAYDAVQSAIRGNHIALVKAARGGDRLSVGDKDAMPLTMVDSNSFVSAVTLANTGMTDKVGKPTTGTMLIAPGYPVGDGTKLYVSLMENSKREATDSGDEAVVTAIDSLLKLIEDHQPTQKGLTMKTIVIDGVTVEFTTDQNAQIVERALAASAKALKDANELSAEELAKLKKKQSEDAVTITTLTTTADGLKAENETLKKTVEDSKMTPAKLDALVADRHVVTGKARAVLGDKLVVDGKTDGEIRRQVVDFKLGDKAKGWSDDQISISFDTLTADVKPTDSSAVLDARRVFADTTYQSQGNDAREVALDARDKNLTDAWRTAGAQAAS